MRAALSSQAVRRLLCSLSILCFWSVAYFHFCPKPVAIPEGPNPIRLDSSDLSYQQARSIYCEAYDLGCFEANGKEPANVFSHSEMDVSECLRVCSDRGLKHVGIRNASDCVCAHMLDHFARLEYTDQRRCDIECPGQSGRVCGGKTTFSGYRLAGECKNGSLISDEFLASRSLGCFRMPSPKASFRSFGKLANGAECFRACQHHSLPLVAYSKFECRCGLMDEAFNLDHRLTTCSAQADSVLLYRTLAEDRRCELVRFLPPTESRTKTLLASFPGSGNTWVRHLLEKAAGYYTGSYYHDKGLFQAGFLGELTENYEYVAVLKDHQFRIWDDRQLQNRTLFLVRNPYDALLSDFNRKASKNHTGIAPRAAFKTGFEKYLKIRVRKWTKRIDEVLSIKRPLMVVYYEELLGNPIGRVREMVNFAYEPKLRPENLEERLHCLSQEIRGDYKRANKRLDFEPFNEGWRKRLDEDIDKASRRFEAAGLPPMPEYKRQGRAKTKDG